jgi:hypothetical protein
MDAPRAAARHPEPGGARLHRRRSRRQAVGSADGWVYAAGGHVIRSRGDGRWEEVPAPGDSAFVAAMAHHDGELLFAVPRPSDERKAKGRLQVRLYRPGRRAGEWRESARSSWPLAAGTVVRSG